MTDPNTNTDNPSIGLVLSGGGARGAYEVGVLLYIAEALPELLSHIRILTGVSVGAVTATFLASRGLTAASVHELAQIWQNFQIDDLLTLSHRSTLRMLGTAPLRLMRLNIKSPATGLLKSDGLWRLVANSIDWPSLHRNIENSRFTAVAIASTDINSGLTHLFVEANEGIYAAKNALTAEFIEIPARLDLPHVLASAAIPLLFSPVRIRDRWYMDGGIRYNTPLSPAIHLGADRLLILSVGGMRAEAANLRDFPGIGQIIGKLLDAVFLDRVAFDLDRLSRINDLVRITEQLDPQQQQRLADEWKKVGRPHYRKVPFVSIQPTPDLGIIASQCIKETSPLSPFSFIRVLSSLFEDDAHSSGDAASFLFFDKLYAQKLIEIGRHDAAKNHHKLLRLMQTPEL